MANRRMIPTQFFKNPNVLNLKSKDTLLILIGLVLEADDEGRGLAHAGLLGREMDYPAEQMEAALQELAANDLLLLYQVGKHRYYALPAWNEWETLSKPTPSRYPAPPTIEQAPASGPLEDAEIPQENFGKSWEILGTPGFSEKPPPEEEGKGREEEEKEEEEGEEKQPQTPRTVIPFPARAGGGKGETGETLIQDLARRLHIPITPALTRLVTEFQGKPDLSLLGEADAARAWLDEPRQRKKGTQMSLPFFRRWLQRACQIQAQQAEAVASLSQEPLRATGTTGLVGPARLPSLMHLDDDIQRGGTRS